MDLSDPSLLTVAVAHAKRMLAIAESNRREPAATFTLTAPANPDADYAAAALLIAQALQHLDEALPSRQFLRASAALSALLIGTELLQQSLRQTTKPVVEPRPW